MSTAGFVAAVVVTLLLGYLVPSLVRRRQAVGDARVPDRFSASLRVVERRRRGGEVTSTTALLPGVPRPAIARAEEHPVNRPTGMAERRSAAEARRVAAVRAALAARRAEQAAAARRRLVITLVLGVVTVVSWVAVAVADFQIGFAVFTTAVLVGILWLGTRAARAERAEWDEVPEHLREPRVATPAGPTYSAAQLREHLATGEGSAASSASAVASVMSDGAAPVAPAGSLAGNGGNLRWSTDAAGADDTPIEAGSGDATPVAGGVGGARAAAPGTWTPVPVPVPTYTLKATALRREVDAPEVTVGAEGAAPSGLSSGEGDWTEQRDERAERVEPGIDLDAVLARRRGA